MQLNVLRQIECALQRGAAAASEPSVVSGHGTQRRVNGETPSSMKLAIQAPAWFKCKFWKSPPCASTLAVVFRGRPVDLPVASLRMALSTNVLQIVFIGTFSRNSPWMCFRSSGMQCFLYQRYSSHYFFILSFCSHNVALEACWTGLKFTRSFRILLEYEECRSSCRTFFTIPQLISARCSLSTDRRVARTWSSWYWSSAWSRLCRWRCWLC